MHKLFLSVILIAIFVSGFYLSRDFLKKINVPASVKEIITNQKGYNLLAKRLFPDYLIQIMVKTTEKVAGDTLLKGEDILEILKTKKGRSEIPININYFPGWKIAEKIPGITLNKEWATDKWGLLTVYLDDTFPMEIKQKILIKY